MRWWHHHTQMPFDPHPVLSKEGPITGAAPCPGQQLPTGPWHPLIHNPLWLPLARASPPRCSLRASPLPFLQPCQTSKITALTRVNF